MKFDKWMSSSGLASASIQKYNAAITGVLTNWAVEAGLIEGSILDITSKSRFDALVIQLSELPIFQERNSIGHGMYSSALRKYSKYLTKGAIQSLNEDIEEILLEREMGPTDRIQLINTRIGQGQFRKSLLSFWGSCAVTGVKTPDMLLASHIKPWSKSTDFERLDKYNGLLLTPNLDRAFDQGLITFASSGSIQISTELEYQKSLGINAEMKVKLSAEHQKYMAFHREQVFQGQ